MSHRRLELVERVGDALTLSCPYVVDVVEEPPGIDNRNALPWSRLFLPDPDAPAGDHRVVDLATRRAFRLLPGEALLLPPDRLYGFRFRVGMRMLAWHFRLEWAPGCDVFARLEGPVVCPDAAAAARAAYAALRRGEDLACAAVLRGVLLQLAGARIGAVPTGAARFHRVLERIERGARADLPVTALATLAGLGREHFAREFRRAVGIAPQALLHRRLVQRACTLLLAGERVKAVADQLGFASESYFSRFFRARTGIPPSRFRLTPAAG